MIGKSDDKLLVVILKSRTVIPICVGGDIGINTSELYLDTARRRTQSRS